MVYAVGHAIAVAIEQFLDLHVPTQRVLDLETPSSICEDEKPLMLTMCLWMCGLNGVARDA